MIFTSLGMLVVAACFFIAGLLKSSIPLLVVSLVGTAGATILLLATADLARRKAWSDTAGAPTAANPAVGATTPVLVYVPADQLPQVMDGASNGHAPASGNGHGQSRSGPPIVGYDDMTADQVARLIASGALSDEQLAAVRSYEQDGQARKTVLDRVDKALRSRR